MSKTKTIVFDFDGVISDSYDLALEVYRLSRPSMTPERFEKLWDGNITKAKFEDKEINKIDFFKEIDIRYKKLGISSEVKTGIKKLNQEFQLFIISSSSNTTIKYYLTKHSILDLFTEIYGYETHKLKDVKFKMLFDKYNLNPDEVIFVTDTSGDVYEAKKARIKNIIGILGFQKYNSLKKSKPMTIVNNFSELTDYLFKKYSNIIQHRDKRLQKSSLN